MDTKPNHTPHRPIRAKPCLAGTTYNAVPLHTSRQFTRSEIDRRPTHGRSPVWRPGATHSRTARYLSTTITNPRMGEALFGGDDLQRCTASHVPTVHTFRERSQTHSWAKPCLATGSYTLPHLLPTSRERSRTLAWAKPCLAGRPTMLVRTQLPETNTSRSRPSGMELPDYPVVVLTPSCRTRMGPHLRFPPGLFPDS
jgi:hypothetical protein